MAKKSVKKSNSKRVVKAKAKGAKTRTYNRRNYPDTARIRVIGENTHKPTSSRGKYYAFFTRCKTVGAYKEALKRAKKSDASAFIRNAVDEKYIKVAA